MWQNGRKHDHVFRYLIISVVFCAVCVFYLGRLFYIQISGRENAYDTGTTAYTEVVHVARGEIYDRNGKLLVTNRYTYDLKILHTPFSTLSLYRSNQACLRLLTALDDCGERSTHVEKYFPFDGAYPNYTLSEETANADSVPYYRMRRMIGDLRLDDDTTPQELLEYYLETYQLLATDVSGNRVFTDSEVDRLLRLRYDMDAHRFSAANDYVIAYNVASSSRLIPYVSELGTAGVSFTVNSAKRVYEYPGVASHILGTVGKIKAEDWEYYQSLGYQMDATVGVDGCEAAFEEYLRGTNGVKRVEVDSLGNIVKETMLTEPVAGKDVYLTIDIDLQIAAEDGLRENVQYVVEHSGGVEENGSGCNAGAAVAMDPRTFEILAIASYPTYDLTTYNSDYANLLADPTNPLLNRALQGLYAPGSTFKLGIAAAALAEGKTSASNADAINCRGEYPPGSAWAVACSTFGKGHAGNTNLITAIAQSCNSFFCKVGEELGIYKIEEYMKKFGFGEHTGIELGERTGVLAGPTYRQEANVGDVWLQGNTWHAAIGQSDNQATPLQLACYTATLANGGTRYSAHLLKSVYAYGVNEPIYTYTQSEETVLDRMNLSPEVQATVFEGMREVVLQNQQTVNRWMSSIPVAVGGKTGTAQTGGVCDNALFVGAAPYDNPQIVVSVILEKGAHGYYASQTAAAILDVYYNGPDAE